MRSSKVTPVEESKTVENVEVKITVKEKENTVNTEEKNPKKAGRKKLDDKDKATERVHLHFTKDEISSMERAMMIEGIDKNSRMAISTFIKKMLQRQMLRNGYEF